MTALGPSYCLRFANGVKTKMKTPTYCYKLVTSFNMLQHNIAQHLRHYFQLPVSFNSDYLQFMYEEWTVHERPCDDIIM